MGRADDQVKLGGRRIELGEVDAAIQALPGITAAAAAVRTTRTGNKLLVGYVVPADPETFDAAAATAQLREQMPAALVPALAVVDTLPTRTSGKVDRDALPWPLESMQSGAPQHGLTGTAGWLADQWTAVLGANVGGADDDFFSHGGGSLSAAQLVYCCAAGTPASRWVTSTTTRGSATSRRCSIASSRPRPFASAVWCRPGCRLRPCRSR